MEDNLTKREDQCFSNPCKWQYETLVEFCHLTSLTILQNHEFYIALMGDKHNNKDIKDIKIIARYSNCK